MLKVHVRDGVITRIETDDGQVLLLWLRQLPTFEDLREFMQGSDDEDLDDDLNEDEFD